ncbi:hypothetical protein JA9_002012 [Meyerozyma sp. JA9]|nr:hypothetical protein JA9_002012 [Meyerozyma sp. JA9]
MKFGKYLASRQLELPEYSGHFIDYKALKKLIKKLATPSSPDGITPVTTVSPVEAQNTLKENRASFFFRVERELEKVNSFYLEKQANLEVNLELLLNKNRELLTRYHEQLERKEGRNPSSSFRNSISYLNLYQNFKKIHQDLIRLQQFIELNETGFSKVVKKWDKRSKSHTRELFISTAVSVQPVFHKNDINELSDMVTQTLFDLESIMDGDFSSLPKYISLQESPTVLAESPSANSDSFHSSNFNSSRHGSVVNVYNSEIDDLYSSFVNIATIKDPDLDLLDRWIEKVGKGPNQTSEEETKLKLSKIFLLSIPNVRIADSFLELFLERINYSVDFTIVSDDFNNKRTVIHQCCSIPPASTQENHAIINNGVKVINSIDSIQHSRTFIVNYMMSKLSDSVREELLACKDFNGRNCLHYAAQNNRLDLLNLVAPAFPRDHLDDLDNESMTALLLAIRHKHVHMIEKLVQMGSNCWPTSSESNLQYLPINYACEYGDYQILEYLLSYSKPTVSLVNQPDVKGLHPLHVTARSGHYKLIRLLTQYGADVNMVDELFCWPPIFYAVSEGHVKTTEELVSLGANLDYVDGDGYNVLYYCMIEGHIDVLNALLKYDKLILKSSAKSWEKDQSLPQVQTENSGVHVINGIAKDDMKTSETKNMVEDDSDNSSLEKSNSEAIPDLQLPPPILPLRRYGHNFLEQKVLIELIFPSEEHFIKLLNLTSDLKPGRITLTSSMTDIVPRNIILPIEDKTRSSNKCIFQTDVDSLNDFRIDFEIFPKFGTRLIAKTSAMSFTETNYSSSEADSVHLPLFDLRLRNVGELNFRYQIIFPFSGALLETSQFDTYWKSSTSFLRTSKPFRHNGASGLSPRSILSPTGLNPEHNVAMKTVDATSNSNATSFVTATSLSGEYLRIKVCLLKDGTPIVCPQWSIAISENLSLYLPNLSLEQLNSITNNLFDYEKVLHDLNKMTKKDLPLIKKLMKIIYLPLGVLLEVLNIDINLSLEVLFPSYYEMKKLPFVGTIREVLNRFIDETLNAVFNHTRTWKVRNITNTRSIIFLSSNSLICKILNWKQPNFPVFFVMNGITYNNKTKSFEYRTTNGILMDNESKNEPEILGRSQEVITRSINEGVNFTVNNNLIGLVISIHLLRLVPKLVPLIRARGLIIVASSDVTDVDDEAAFSKDLDSYTKAEINGLRFDDIMSFKDDIA